MIKTLSTAGVKDISFSHTLHRIEIQSIIPKYTKCMALYGTWMVHRCYSKISWSRWRLWSFPWPCPPPVRRWCRPCQPGLIWQPAALGQSPTNDASSEGSWNAHGMHHWLSSFTLVYTNNLIQLTSRRVTFLAAWQFHLSTQVWSQWSAQV